MSRDIIMEALQGRLEGLEPSEMVTVHMTQEACERGAKALYGAEEVDWLWSVLSLD